MKSFIQFLIESNMDSPFSEVPTETKYNPSYSSLVHLTSHFPLRGTIETLGSLSGTTSRETLHFTRNGSVSSHMWGNWDNSKFGIMIPEDAVSHRILNGTEDHDLVMHGNLSLPSNSKIIMNWDKMENHEKDHVAALVKASTHEEALTKISKVGDGGIRGHPIEMDGRRIILANTHVSATKDDSAIKHSIDGHLREHGIHPVTIGSEYAIGYVDESPRTEYAKEFFKRHGLDSEGYDNKNYKWDESPSVPSSQQTEEHRRVIDSRRLSARLFHETDPFDKHIRSIRDYYNPTNSQANTSISRASSANSGGDKGGEQAYFGMLAAHPDAYSVGGHPDFRGARVGKHIRTGDNGQYTERSYDMDIMKNGLVRYTSSLTRSLEEHEDILQNPSKYHPTGFSSPESKEAIKRNINKYDLALQGIAPGQIGTSQDDAHIQRKTDIITETNRLKFKNLVSNHPFR